MAGVSYPEVQHALTRALGAIVRSIAHDEVNRAAAVAMATRADRRLR